MNFGSTAYHTARYTSPDTGCCGCIVLLVVLVVIISTLSML